MNADVAGAVDQRIKPEFVRPSPRKRWFFTAMATAITVAVFIGFAPTYYLKDLAIRPLPLPLRVQIHGALFTAWVVLFLVQTFLIASHRTALHRRLGLVGGLLVIPMLTSGLTVAVTVARQHPLPPDTGPFAGMSPLLLLVIPFTSVVLFSLSVGLGLLYRRRGDVHKRLMLLGTIALLPPALGRVPALAARGPAAFFVVTALFIVSIALYDYWTRKRLHAVTLWGGLFLAASFPGRIAVGNTAVWMVFARWLIS